MIVHKDKSASMLCPYYDDAYEDDAQQTYNQMVQQQLYTAQINAYKAQLQAPSLAAGSVYTTTAPAQVWMTPPGKSIPPHRCRGPACMLWREMANDMGYCGLGPQPENMAAFFKGGDGRDEAT